MVSDYLKETQREEQGPPMEALLGTRTSAWDLLGKYGSTLGRPQGPRLSGSRLAVPRSVANVRTAPQAGPTA